MTTHLTPNSFKISWYNMCSLVKRLSVKAHNWSVYPKSFHYPIPLLCTTREISFCVTFILVRQLITFEQWSTSKENISDQKRNRHLIYPTKQCHSEHDTHSWSCCQPLRISVLHTLCYCLSVGQEASINNDGCATDNWSRYLMIVWPTLRIEY